MALRTNLVREHGTFGTLGRYFAEFILTPLVFFGLEWCLLYFGTSHLPLWLVAITSLLVGALCYRSIVGIHRQFFTQR